MPQIKLVRDGSLITTTEQPVWVDGVWECGNCRLADTDRLEYEEVPSAPVYRDLKPIEFYLAFAPRERMLIKALASPAGIPEKSALMGGTNAAIPQDAVISEFWDTYLLAVQTNSMISPGLTSVQEGLAYMTAPTSPTPQIFTVDRIPEISAGSPQ